MNVINLSYTDITAVILFHHGWILWTRKKIFLPFIYETHVALFAIMYLNNLCIFFYFRFTQQPQSSTKFVKKRRRFTR